MALNTNFNVNPFYDDFDEDKKFLRLLFKPGFAVQSRELTQLQTILQNQVERFGEHIFKNGSVVTGGQFFIQEATYLKLDAEYNSVEVFVDDFSGQTIFSIDESKRAEVIRVYDVDQGTGDPKTLLVKQIYGEPFTSNEVIKTSGESPYFATISTNGVGQGQTFSVNEGIFYYGGLFIKNNAQTVATSKYSVNDANVKVGFEIEESIVTFTEDTSLLDPAQNASNYQAPGADRYKIDLILATRSLDSVDEERFIELVRVEDGEIVRENRYPIYSVLEDTLARRTYDESGNYTVKPFQISLETNEANTAQTKVIVSPGKAYVYGYEHETISPTIIIVDKPRETAEVQNKRISADYGNFVYTTNHSGSFPINSLGIIDLHCVGSASINATSTGTIANTKIGTARAKTFVFDSAANTANSQTYEYKTFLFDVKTTSITGNVVAASSNTTHVALSATNSNYSSVTNAYIGAKIRIITGPGSNETPKRIIGYNGTTKIAEVSTPFSTALTNASVFSIDFEASEIESLAVYSTTTKVASADVSVRSKDLATPYNDTYISDSAYAPLVFRLGEEYIAPNTVEDMSYEYKRLYSTQAFSSSQSSALPVGTYETLTTASTDTQKIQNYYITVTTQGTSPYTAGTVIPADKFTVDAVNRIITVENGNNMIANIVSTIDVSLSNPKVKTFVDANETIQTSGGANVFGNNAVILYGTHGQTHIAASYVVKVPNQAQSLFASDVFELVDVLDFRGNAISQANSSTALSVVDRYDLDTGQRDSFYDHASIKLRPGFTPPLGPIVVRYKRFTSTGPGYFDVDSYAGVDYDVIPTFISPTNNARYDLRDCIDFRPVRNDAVAGGGSAVVFGVDSTGTGPKIPQNGSTIRLDYEYYLPRIDKVILDKNRTFEVVKGISSINPARPNDTDTGMTLYVLNNPPYVSDTSEIRVEYINNKRYTMRDIGTLERRIDNLEYYTSLSLLETDTLSKQDLTILDTQNLPRFKNGILVDAFNGHSVADVTNSEYVASIDPKRKELRPSFNISSYGLTFDSANSTNFLQSGPIITANATSVSTIEQNKASRALNVNPFNVVNFLGRISLDPQSDVWIDQERQADVLVNIGGDRDAWQFIVDKIGVEYEWDSWQTYWTGTTVSSRQVREGNRLNEYTTTTVTQEQTRTGVLSEVVPQSIVQSIGDRVVDVSVIPYMRETNVLFVGESFKPNTTVYPFFDNVSVENFVANRVNRFVLSTNNIGLKTQVGDPEFVDIIDNSTDQVIGEALVVHTSNNIVYATNVEPTQEFTPGNIRIVGEDSGLTYNVVSFEHNGGVVQNVTANTITLRIDAAGASNIGSYVGSPIFIVQGPGSNQVKTITAYNPSTRVVTISGTWDRLPVAGQSFYSIGRPKTDAAGSVAGIFTIPAGRFRIGEKLFRLTDTVSGDIGSSSTNGDATFFAQGLLQTLEETIISTIAPTIQRTDVTDERVVVNSTTTRRTIRTYSDPLAQTFLVGPVQYPQGFFLSKIRVCFKSKDDTVPVTLEVRSTVNGYPSSSEVYPFGSVTLTPDKVKVTDNPDINDPSKYTEFVFDAPIFLQPGEHSFVLLANTIKYEVYIAEIGKLDLVTNTQISEQPYGGSLFLSQNGSTWTADQSSDMMFQLFRYRFDTNPFTADFLVNTPAENVPFDVIHLITSDATVANTTLGYTFNSEKSTGGFAGFKPITPLTNLELNDGDGRRVLNTSTGNTTFVLRATMQTNNPDVSPFIDITRTSMLLIENKINNLPLSNSGIIVANTGSGYANSSDVVVTISGGNGSGAAAVANVVNGAIDAVYITEGGFGYTETPTITVTPLSTGSGAEILYAGEDGRKGGTAAARYVTRKVTLADGFDSGDLRVYLTAYKPIGSNILVYYKILSSSDPDIFDDKNWQLMTQLSNVNFFSNNNRDYRELTFAPGTDNINNDAVSYVSDGSSYSSFRTFAIKIVMVGTNTTDVPKVRDLRAIALPAG